MKKILIAIDDELFGKAVADFVIEHKWSSDTEFQIINVFKGPDLSEIPPQYWEDILEKSRARAEKLLADIAAMIQRSLEKVSVNARVIDGLPADEIVKIAGEWEADLVIVGSHGRRGLQRFLLGSVSQAVVSHAPCSVAVVRVPTASAG